jgi:GT2 family glycosyltransferase
MMPKIRMAILVAVHNRWNLTDALLTEINAQISNSGIELCIHLFDDGSTDETQEQILQHPVATRITFLKGDGTLYWAKSMKMAEDSITDEIDYILWLNNDVKLVDDFFTEVLRAIQVHPKAILVGQTCDSVSGHVTYGGLIRTGRHPLRVSRLEMSTTFASADTFNGNIVVIPREANELLGGIEGSFEHGYADLDFGYRAKRLGIRVLTMPGILGSCNRNEVPLPSRSVISNIKTDLLKKHLPIRSQMRFCFRHGGPEWLIYAFAPYLKRILGRSKTR